MNAAQIGELLERQEQFVEAVGAQAKTTANGWLYAGNTSSGDTRHPYRLCLLPPGQPWTGFPRDSREVIGPGWFDIPNHDPIVALYPAPNNSVFIKCADSEWLLCGNGWDTFELKRCVADVM